MSFFGLLDAVVRVRADSSGFDDQLAALGDRVSLLGSTLTKTFGPFSASLAAIGVAAKATTSAVSVLNTAVAGVTLATAVGGATGFRAIAAGISRLAAVVPAAMTPLRALSSALTGLGPAAVRGLAGLRSFGAAALSAVTSSRLFAAGLNAIRPALASIGGGIKNVVEGYVLIGGAIKSALGVLDAPIRLITAGIAKIAPAFRLAMAPLVSVASAARAAAVSLLSAVSPTHLLGAAFTRLSGIVRQAGSAISGAMSMAFQGMFRTFGMVNSALGTVGAAFEHVLGALKPLASALDGILATAFKVAAGAAVGFTAAVIGSIKVAGDMEHAYNTLRRVTGMTAKETDDLAAKLQNIARNSGGASIREINSIAEFAGRMGIGSDKGANKSEEIAKFTKSIANVKMVLGGMQIDTAATEMLRILKVYHQGTAEATSFASALVALDNASTATGSELLDMTQRMSGILSIFHATIPQTLALAAAMRDTGIDVEVGSTAVGRLLSAMNVNVKKFAGAVGLDFRTLAQTISTDPVKAVEMFMAALSKLTPSKQAATLAALHMQGQRTGPVLLQLASNMKDLSKFINIANEEWTTHKAIEEGVEIVTKETWSQLTMLGNRLMLVGLEIGKSALPAFKALTGVLNNLTDVAIEKLKASAPTFNAWGEKVANAIRMVGTVFQTWPQWLVVAEVSLKEAFNNMAAIATRLGKGLWNLFKDLFQSIGEMVKNTVTEMVRAAGAAVEMAMLAVSNPQKFQGKLMGEAIQKGLNKNHQAPWEFNKGAVTEGVTAPSFKGLGAKDLFGNLPGVSPMDQARRQSAMGAINAAANPVTPPTVPAMKGGAAMVGAAEVRTRPLTARQRKAKQHERAVAMKRERRAKYNKAHGLPMPGAQAQQPQVTPAAMVENAGKTTGLLEFAKEMQENVFGGGKDDTQKQLLDATNSATAASTAQAAATKSATTALNKIAKGVPVTFTSESNS